MNDTSNNLITDNSNFSYPKLQQRLNRGSQSSIVIGEPSMMSPAKDDKPLHSIEEKEHESTAKKKKKPVSLFDIMPEISPNGL